MITSVFNEIRNIKKTCLFLLVFILLLTISIWPALYNKFPLVLTDSAHYMMGKADRPGHPSFYTLMSGFILKLGSPFIICIVSSFLSLIVLLFFLYKWEGNLSAKTLLICVFVLLTTRLPWLNSLLMPDIYGGIGILAIITLLESKRKKSIFVDYILLFIVFISLLSQTTSIIIFPVFIICIKAISKIFNLKINYFLTLIYLTILSGTINSIENKYKFNKMTINTNAVAILFSKFVDHGIAQEYLEKKCLSVHYKICNFTKELKDFKNYEDNIQPFLWVDVNRKGSLAQQTDAYQDPDKEFLNITINLLKEYPYEFLKFSVSDNLQLLANKGEVYGDKSGIWPFHKWSSEFNHARQQNNKLNQELFNKFYFFSYILYSLYLACSLIKIRDKKIKLLIASTLILIIVNSFIHATFVGPYYRYQDKIDWIPALVAAFIFSSSFNTILKKSL